MSVSKLRLVDGWEAHTSPALTPSEKMLALFSLAAALTVGPIAPRAPALAPRAPALPRTGPTTMDTFAEYLAKRKGGGAPSPPSAPGQSFDNDSTSIAGRRPVFF